MIVNSHKFQRAEIAFIIYLFNMNPEKRFLMIVFQNW